MLYDFVTLDFMLERFSDAIDRDLANHHAIHKVRPFIGEELAV